MGVVDQKHELFDSIVRLRRVGRELPGSPDVAAVRASIEKQLGETVSKRFAARVLGVSHTAVERWIKSGDLPVVHTRGGKLEIPVPALVELYEQVAEDRLARPQRYALTPTMTRQRTAAEELRLDDLKGLGAGDRHRRALARNLAYHRAIAKRLRRPMVEEARHVLYRWQQNRRIDQRYAERWRQILDQPIPVIRKSLVDPSPDGDDLRQNSPFAGMLSEPERRRILEEVG